jgi:hypothetical protein
MAEGPLGSNMVSVVSNRDGKGRVALVSSTEDNLGGNRIVR